MKYLLFLLSGLLLSIVGQGQTLIQAEYFFDTDPGLGLGTSITFSPTDSISLDSLVINTPGLTLGYHFLYVRAKGADGVWGFTERKRVYLYEDFSNPPASSSLVSGEYFFDTDSIEPGRGVFFSFPPDDSISLNFQATAPNLGIGSHTLYVRVKDSFGEWSFLAENEFKVCSTYDPTPDFVWDENGRTIFFWDSSRLATKYHWDFGDGNTDTTVNPSHKYSSVGSYEVELTAQNICGENKVSQLVEINGTKNFEPKYYANDGFFPMYIEGFGFTLGSTIRLEKAGSPAIVPELTLLINSESLQVNFRINEVDTGYYDLIYINPVGQNDTVFNGFEFKNKGKFDLFFTVSGQNPILLNQPTNYQIIVENSGNKTAYAIPVFVRTIGEGVKAEVLNDFQHTDSIPQSILDSLPSSHFYPDFDSLENDSVNIGGFIIPYLLPGKRYTINIRLISRIGSNYIFDLDVLLGNPLIENSELVDRGLKTLCDSYLPPAIDCALSAAAFVPVAACGVGVTTLVCGIVREMDNGVQDPRLIDWIGDVSGTLLACNPLGVFNSARKAFQIAKRLGGYSWKFKNFAGSCYRDEFFPKGSKKNSIKVVNSSDPNLKAGLLGFGGLNYLPYSPNFPYQVFYENVDTATAPATQVIIIDTIDSNVFDINSFQFWGFNFSDSTYLFQQGQDSFVTEIDLRPTKAIILRISGQFDETNGIAIWRFVSLDTARLDVNQVAANGFLRPNINKPEGEGFVLFSINTISGLPHDTEIRNRASITFDYNDPIITDWHSNTLDLIPPISSVNNLPSTISNSDLVKDSLLIVNWSGTDQGAGIVYYDVYLSVGNDTNFTKWKSLTTETFDTLAVEVGETYRFYSIAYDGVGNVEMKGDTIEAITTISTSTNIDDNDLLNNVSIYPNPSNGLLNLTVSGFSESALKIKINSLVGREILSQTYYSNNQNKISEKIDIEDFPSGVYLIRIVSDGGVEIAQKLIKY